MKPYRIAVLEPFYAGSHKQWCESLKQHSAHRIDVLSLPGRHWKWRMHVSAVWFAELLNRSNEDYDLLLCSDLVDVATLRGLLNRVVPVASYFHENQLTYPISDASRKLNGNRDMHYAWLNFTTCLASDEIWFNSEHNRDSWFAALPGFLKSFPDFNPKRLDVLKAKSRVIPVGIDIDVPEYQPQDQDWLTIAWNHRWEYDKNPQEFMKLLLALKASRIPFKLILLGERNKKNEFPGRIESEFADRILYSGYPESREEYLRLLSKADILPVTSHHDFFGISVMEAAMCGVYPLVPNRLAYPELFGSFGCTYQTFEELVERVKAHDPGVRFTEDLGHYRMEHVVKTYDRSIASLIEGFDQSSQRSHDLFG